MIGVAEQINWSQMSLAELQGFWCQEIEPALEAAGHDRNPRPGYPALVDVGYSGICYTLREHHDQTLAEFLESVGYPPPNGGDYDWGIDHERTVGELEAYLESQRRRRSLADSTVEGKRSRLATYARTYGDCHETADLVGPLADPSTESAEIERVLAVFDRLEATLSTDASKLRYHSDVDQFYEHLTRRAVAQYNPAASIPVEFGWSRAEPDNEALTSEQVRTLCTACTSSTESLVVLGLCAWGLRRSELASLHASQLVLEDEDPHITFEERKNGPGTVALLYGLEELADRIDELEATDRDWTGYLFPSRAAASGHVIGETIQARFQQIADRAAVRVDGDLPTSKMGRRFWYRTYLEATKDLARQLEPIAADQGSSDEQVVVRNYLSEADRRRYRREFMRDRLADVFESSSSPSSGRISA